MAPSDLFGMELIMAQKGPKPPEVERTEVKYPVSRAC